MFAGALAATGEQLDLSGWRLVPLIVTGACAVLAILLMWRSKPDTMRRMAGQAAIGLGVISFGVVLLPNGIAVLFLIIGAVIFVGAFGILGNRRLGTLHRQSVTRSVIRLDRAVPEGTPTPPPFTPGVIDAATLPTAKAAAEHVRQKARKKAAARTANKNQGLDLVALVRALAAVRRTRAALRTHRSHPLLFLWVFDGEPQDALLQAIRGIGPVHYLRGGTALTGVTDLGRAIARPGSMVEETEAEVLAAIAKFKPTRFGITYRLNSLVCNGDVWQFAVDHLLAISSAVVMDLSKYSRQRAGCTYELGVLVDRVPMDKVTFVVDSPEDVELLRSTLEPIWATMAVDSPNRSARTGPVVAIAVAPPAHDFMADEPTDNGSIAAVAELVAASTGGPPLAG